MNIFGYCSLVFKPLWFILLLCLPFVLEWQNVEFVGLFLLATLCLKKCFHIRDYYNKDTVIQSLLEEYWRILIPNMEWTD
jgi:hypothetical protein